MISYLYKYRFEIFLASQITVLFGSLIIPASALPIVSQILFYLNIIAGSLFIGSNRKSRGWVVVMILIIIGGVFAYSAWDKTYVTLLNYLKLGILFIFHVVVTFQIIKQVWQAKLVNKNVIFGMMSGYISLGLIGFFICTTIVIVHPDSFYGLAAIDSASNTITERLMYFSYITMLTIGYGEIIPVTHLAQKATILIGLMGQFYLVIITAIVIGKYLSNRKNN